MNLKKYALPSNNFAFGALAAYKFRPLRPEIEARLAFRIEHPGMPLPLSLPAAPVLKDYHRKVINKSLDKPHPLSLRSPIPHTVPLCPKIPPI